MAHWNALRTYGPVPRMRYDPHPEPLMEHGPDSEGVLYTSADLPDDTAGATARVGLATALAEVYQDRRTIDTFSGAPYATSWTPARPLHLLDLSGQWSLRNQAAFVLTTGRKDVSRAWAKAIRETWPDLDGLWSVSTLTGGPNVTLWNPSRDSFPPAPDFSRPLRHGQLVDLVEKTAKTIAYELIR